MIWNHASHYATPELTYGLLRKISAEVINRCGGDVAVQDILDGTNLGDCQQTLRDSIAAGEAWKASYVSTKSAVNRRAGDDESRRWDFREASLFAQIDAFVQRCKDLMEVCEAQEQFAGKSGVAPPVFAGTKGPEITRQMSDIERDFVELVESLRGLDYHLMDIKATSWHDDYNTFKEGVKTLDQRTIQVYTSALDAASGLEGKTETLEALNQMARRVGVKRHVEKQVTGLYGEFTKELVSVRKQFDSQRATRRCTRACRGTRAARCGPSSCTIGSPNRGPSSRLRQALPQSRGAGRVEGELRAGVTRHRKVHQDDARAVERVRRGEGSSPRSRRGSTRGS